MIGEQTALGMIHNHSSRPTAYSRIEDKNINFYALCDLQPDDEITCNYNQFNDVVNIERAQDGWS